MARHQFRRTRAGLLGLLIAMLLATPLHSGRAEIGDREVCVSVRVRASSGEDLAGVIVALADGPESPVLVDAVTDALGVAVLTASVKSSVTAAHVRWMAAPDGRSVLGDAYERQIALLHHSSLQTRHHLPRSRAVMLQPGVETYAIEIVARPTICVHARAIDENGAPVRAVIYGGDSRTWPSGVLDKLGRPLCGVAQGVAAIVAVATPDERFVRVGVPIALDAAMTADDVDIGSVTIPSLSDSVSIDVELRGIVSERSSSTWQSLSGATFVAERGDLIISFPTELRGRLPTTGPDFQLALIGGGEGPPALPPGRYYLAPGWFCGTEDQENLITLILAGADLSQSSVVSIDVGFGPRAALSVDVIEASSAIRSAIRLFLSELGE